jgi:hypothetical protein
MVQLKAQDFSSDKREYKEYLVWECNWYAKNWLGTEISPRTGHIEGKYSQNAERADVLGDKNALDTEIECPSCQNTIGLYSVSKSPYYGCDDCKFCLYTK